jgi:glyceraldehyde-3-phosphate dehydrogenase (NADP+)
MSALRDVAAWIDGDAERLARLIVTEGIKTIREARKEVSRAADTFRLSAEEARRIGGEVMRFDQTASAADRRGWWTRQPLGVVFGITPYNDPLNLVAHKVGPAIACGAPILIKPHSRTPTPALEIARAFARAGLADSIVQVVDGGPDVVAEISRDDRVAVISFTGGPVAGKPVAHAAAGKRVLLELGGTCAAVVMANANIERATEALVAGATWAAGQNCVHTQRIFIEAPIYDLIAEGMATRIARLKVGEQLDEMTDVGPLVSEAHAARVSGLIESAVRAGARLLIGGKREGRKLWPTLLSGVPETHELATAEVFAPITLLDAVGSLDDAISRANAPGPMINAALFTDSLRDMLEWQDRIDAGSVIINDSTDFRIDAMPFGGNGAAGLGREGVRFAIEAMTEPKLFCLRA